MGWLGALGLFLKSDVMQACGCTKSRPAGDGNQREERKLAKCGLLGNS